MRSMWSEELFEETIAYQGLRWVPPIPKHMEKSLRDYVRNRVPTGDFLRAVLCNDLREACGRADCDNILVLGQFVSYLHNEAPAACWGSAEKVDAWINKFAAARAEVEAGEGKADE